MMEKYPGFCKEGGMVRAMIKDRRDAVALVGRLFLDIVKTPDLTCALGSKEMPQIVSTTVKLSSIVNYLNTNYVPEDCFDPEVVAFFGAGQNPMVVIGQAGMYFNSVKEKNPLFKNYKSDIGVRGIWVDKLLAMKFLVDRHSEVRDVEDIKGSMVDHPQIMGEVLDIISHITLGTKLSNPIPFVDANNRSFRITYDLNDSYTIPELKDRGVARFLGLPEKSNIEFARALLGMTARSVMTEDTVYAPIAKDFVSIFSVYKKDVTESFSNPNFDVLFTDEAVYGASKRTPIAAIIVKSIKNGEFIKTIDKDMIKKVYEHRAQGVKDTEADKLTVPENFTEGQKEALALPLDVLIKFLDLRVKGYLITLEEIFEIVSDMNQLQTAFSAFWLPVEEMRSVITFKQESVVIPSEISEEEKRLYSFELAVLRDFLNAKLDGINQLQLGMLKLLPTI